jgi:hypothetical protein
MVPNLLDAIARAYDPQCQNHHQLERVVFVKGVAKSGQRKKTLLAKAAAGACTQDKVTDKIWVKQ